MADSFIRVVLRDGTTHNVVTKDPAGVVDHLAKGQGWPVNSDFVEVDGGGAVTRRLVAADQIAHVELFER